MPYSKYIDRVHALGEEVYQAKVFQGDEFRKALCNLIAEIPPQIESAARDLCREVECPPASEIVAHLRRDIDAHEDDPNFAVVFYPLMRVAVAIRSGEIANLAA